MASFNDLPELVILGILGNVINDPSDAANLASNLTCLAICQQWRYLAMPQVYSNLFIYMDSLYMDGDNIVSNVYTNISLLHNNNCEKMVKQLRITHKNLESFAYEFEPMLKVFDTYETDGLEYYAREQDIFDPSKYEAQKLDDEMFEKMVGILKKFRATFANINYIHLRIKDGCGITRQFSSELVGLYSEQLSSLIHITHASLDLPCFPPNLTKLTYVVNGHSFLPVPKINIQSLEVLELAGLPVDFSWQQTCGGLEFPCLKKLKVEYISGTVHDIRNERAANLGIVLDDSIIEREPLEFPMLDTLYLEEFGNHVGILNIKMIPAHLDKLYFRGEIGKLDILSKLPIKSIKDISASLGYNISDANQVYTITNWLLGEGVKNCQKCYLQYDGSDFDIDFERTEWVNVKELSVAYRDTNVLVTELAAMPQLESMSISLLTYSNEEIDWNMLANSKLSNLEINSVDCSDEEEDMVEYLVELFKTLKCLKYANITNEICKQLTEKLGLEKEEHKHLENIEIEEYDE